MSRPSSSTSARTTTPTAPTPSEESATTSGNYRHSATPSPSTRRPDPVHRGFSDQAAGIPNLTALDTVADAMRSIVTAPMVKGEMSTRLTAMMAPPHLRFCRPCNATHVYEQPFRLSALRAGLELEAGTSPPVLRPIPGFRPAATVPDRFDVVRAYLRLLGPATPKLVAGYLDAPVKDVQARWPGDAAEVTVDDERRWLLTDDVERLDDAPPVATRLLGPFDLFLQA